MGYPYIAPVEPTPEQTILIDALAMSAVRETETPMLAVTMLLASATKIIFQTVPPKQAIADLDEIIEGARQAVREAMN